MSTQRKELTFAGACLIGFLVLILITQPSDLPAPLLVAPFLLLFLCMFFTFHAVVVGWTSKSKGMRLALLFAGFPVVLLAFQSVGQLSWRDATTIGVLFIVSYVYLSRLGHTGR